MVVALDRENIASHSAVRPIAAPHLLAPRPCRLADGALAPWQPIVLLKLVGAVQCRHVGRGGQAGADAEAVDRGSGLKHLREVILRKSAAGEDAHFAQSTFVEDAADTLG